MRVLWFTPVPLPPMLVGGRAARTGFGGHWIWELFRRVTLQGDVELGVATAFPGLEDGHHEDQFAQYFRIGRPRRSPTFRLSSREIKQCLHAVEAFRPNLIHFHGSEQSYGLVKAQYRVAVPAVVSLQGVLSAYATHRNFFGALSPLNVVRSTRLIEVPLRLGLIRQYLEIRAAACIERRSVAACDGILGRTNWDRSWAHVLNPDAPYHEVGEILRPPFSAAEWALEGVSRHSIIFTNGGHPRRGTEDLLDALAILRREFPDVRLRLSGRISRRSGYGRFIFRKIERLGLADHVQLLGYLDGPAMATELGRSHVFAIASYVENSPNSLGEAMLLGMPCVASYVGGIPSLVESGRTGLLYPAGDIAMLAESIRTLFLNDEMARAIGREARAIARKRYDPARVVEQLITAYRSVLGQSRAPLDVRAP